jgi:hypothetical protein
LLIYITLNYTYFPRDDCSWSQNARQPSPHPLEYLPLTQLLINDRSCVYKFLKLCMLSYLWRWSFAVVMWEIESEGMCCEAAVYVGEWMFSIMWPGFEYMQLRAKSKYRTTRWQKLTLFRYYSQSRSFYEQQNVCIYTMSNFLEPVAW